MIRKEPDVRDRTVSESESVSSTSSSVPLFGIYSRPRGASSSAVHPLEPEVVVAPVGNQMHRVSTVSKEEYIEMGVAAERVPPMPISPQIRRKFPAPPPLNLDYEDSPHAEALYRQVVPESPSPLQLPILPEEMVVPIGEEVPQVQHEENIYDTVRDEVANVILVEPRATTAQKYRLAERLTQVEKVMTDSKRKMAYTALGIPAFAITAGLSSTVPTIAAILGNPGVPVAVSATSFCVAGVACGVSTMLVKDIACLAYDCHKARKEAIDIVELIGTTRL